MTSQEDNKSSPPAAGANLASKFQRKTKFRRASVSQSDTEFIPGLSNPPGVEDADAKEPLTEPPPPSADSAKSDGSPATESETTSESGMNEDDTADSAEPAVPSPSRSPKMEMKTPVLSPDPSHRATSPPESVRIDAADSIASSPRKSMSPEAEIKPPPAETTPEPEPNIRPFSPEELDQAKSLVLDLLGWGVEPEFLVTSGVSAEAIYRIFTDLNLRLPKNLEVSEDVKAMAYSWGPIPGDSTLPQPVD